MIQKSFPIILVQSIIRQISYTKHKSLPSSFAQAFTLITVSCETLFALHKLFLFTNHSESSTFSNVFPHNCRTLSGCKKGLLSNSHPHFKTLFTWDRECNYLFSRWFWGLFFWGGSFLQVWSVTWQHCSCCVICSVIVSNWHLRFQLISPQSKKWGSFIHIRAFAFWN